jgi:hypothetical protein
MNFKFFHITLLLSIVVQVITAILEVGALFMNIPKSMLLIKQLLKLELFVQFIEGSFYVWLIYNLNNVTDITPKRYLDWAITTPTMLVTLILYLIYIGNQKEKEEQKEEEKEEEKALDFFELIKDNFPTISFVLILNWLMLLFGYLGEIKMLPTMIGVGIGFIPFLMYYLIIYNKYAILSESGLKLFWYFFIVWSLYGIVAVLPYYLKNSFYNILDLFSKNFFGIFLSYIIFSQSL